MTTGYRFIAPRTRMPTVAPRADAPAEPIGRAGVLAELEARLECARAGQRQLVFLAGEAGIGKTTVLDAFVTRAGGEPDVMIARGACLEHYGVTGDVFASRVGSANVRTLRPTARAGTVVS